MAAELPPEADWLARVQALRVYARGGQRAPHKPLLLLYALGHFQREGNSGLEFASCRKDLRQLINTYNANPTSEAYPFKHLESDLVWEVRTNNNQEVQANAGWLEGHEAVGFLADGFAEALTSEPSLLDECAWSLLNGNFAPTLHNDILEVVGLTLGLHAAAAEDIDGAKKRVGRTTGFRAVVLRAYEHQCAMCGWDAMDAGSAIGLEAAHVRGVFADGPNEIANGLSLCILHHKLYDLGMLGITHDRRVQVSENFVARSALAADHVLGLSGQELLLPQKGYDQPADEHIAWHGETIFKGPARAA